MISDKICRYLSRLDGVTFNRKNDSGSTYFNAPRVIIRVSDHLACSYSPTTTLNIVCDRLTESFSVFYGNRIVPLRTYEELRSFLRHFVMVADVLAPLATIRKAPKVASKEKVVTKEKVVEKVITITLPTDSPTSKEEASSDWLWIGDLPDKLRPGVVKNYLNIKKMSHIA